MRLTRCLLYCLISFISGCGINASFAAQSASKVQLALNWKAEPQFGGFYNALIDRSYDKAGLNVTIVEGGSGAPVSQLVASKKMDFGVVTGDEVVVAQARGLDIVALFAVYQTFPQGIMTHESKNYKSIEDVFKNPGQLALQKGVPYVLYLEKIFAANKKVNIVPYTGGIAAFAKNKNFSQQCFVTSEPIAARKVGVRARTFFVAETGYNPYTTVVITHRGFLKNNRGIASQFLKATTKGWQSYLKNSKPANTYMRKLNPSMDEETFKLSAEVQAPLIETPETKKMGLGYMNKKRWAKLTEQLVEVGVIQKSDARPPSSYFEWILGN